MKAQQVILKELNREFGGAAKAQAKATFSSKNWANATNELDAAFREWGRTLDPIIALVIELGRVFIDVFATIPRVINDIGEGAANLAALATGVKQAHDEMRTFEETSKSIGIVRSSFDDLNKSFQELVLLEQGWTPFMDLKDPSVRTLDTIKQELVALQKIGFKTNEQKEQEKRLREELSEKIQQNSNLIIKHSNAQEKLNGQKDKYLITLDKQLNTLEHTMFYEQATIKGIFGRERALGKMILKQEKLTSWQKIQIEFGDDLNKLSEEDLNLLIEKAKAIDQYNKEVKEGIEFEKAAAEAVKLRNKFIKEQLEAVNEIFEANMEHARELAEAEIEIINAAEERELDRIRNTWAYKKATDKEKQRMEEAASEQFRLQKEAETKAANEEIKKQFRNRQKLQAAEAIMSTAKGVAEAGNPRLWWMIPMIIANGLAQLATINAQQPPTMRYGGLVGGQRHEQGGTMIEAERGEFVMRREAVQAVGIETMNRINQGGQQASVNISFSGNILSEEFITEEAIPKIKQAIRRGADIGIG